MSARIALATCESVPDWERDDEPLRQALRRLDVDLHEPAWDDADFDWAACDACLIRTTWDYHTRRRDYVAWAYRVATVTKLFNPAPIVEWNTRKSYLRDLERRGAPVVPTLWLESAAPVDLGAEMARQGWQRGFLKPVVGHTAIGTLRFDADAAGLERARRHLASPAATSTMLLQPYLDRVERDGELSVVWIDGAVSHCVRKVPVAGDYRVQDDHGAHDEPCDPGPEVEGLAESIIEAAGDDLLYARVDLLVDDAGDLRLSELELTEPSLFFRHAPEAAERLARALLNRL